LEKNWKSFHFQEMDWLICFPSTGNEGRKYLYYSVIFKDRKKGSANSQVCLMDLVDTTEFEKNYPDSEEGKQIKKYITALKVKMN